MYPVSTPLAIVLDRVRENPNAVVRLERILGAINADEIVETNEAGVERLLTERDLIGMPGRTGAFRLERDPVLIFGTYRWDENEEAEELKSAHPSLRAPLFFGTDPWTFRDHRMYRREHNYVCQSGWEVHSAYGCLHACDYCFVPSYFNIMLDIDELADRLRSFGETIPEQKLFKFDNYTDTIPLEPEYGASETLVNMFADWQDRYLLLYTKSDNVEHLLNLDHKGKTLVSWSLSCETSAREIEKKTPSPDERIKAMEQCQAAGYPVRARISPTIPVRDWRTEYATLIDRLLQRVRPEVITIDVLGWMTAVQMQDALDTGLFADEYADEIARQAAKELPVQAKHLFPHEMRAEMLRFLIEEVQRRVPDQAISLCNETTDMWRELSPLIRMTPGNYVCCCGPTSTPGNKLLTVTA
jgi:spore photoproduct lyase